MEHNRINGKFTTIFWQQLITICMYLLIEVWIVLNTPISFHFNTKTIILFILYISTILLLTQFIIPFILRINTGIIYKVIMLMLLIPIHGIIIVSYGLIYSCFIAKRIQLALPNLTIISMIIGHSSIIIILSFANAFWAEYVKTQQVLGIQKSAEIQYLKDLNRLYDMKERSQLSDHFVGNLLYRCYDLYHNNPPDNGKMILQISQLVEYSFMAKEWDEKVLLIEEMEQIKRYISLSNFLDEQSCYCQFDFTPSQDFEIYYISPHLLLTFVENVFKHGMLGDKSSPAVIQTWLSNNILTFHTRNKISNKNTESIARDQFGLEAIRHRLEVQFPDKHKLLIRKDGDMFDLLLKLEL